MTDTSDRSSERISTGIPGLDAILAGGLLRRGVYMLQGRPGAGKTILANQLSFHHANGGGHIIYATLLAETHERLLHYISQLDFFDISKVPQQLVYVSAFATLQEGGLKGLAELLRREARSRNASLIVLDGLLAAEEHAESQNEFKKFIQELQIHANLLGHTVLLLTSASTGEVRAEHTMVDGVIDVSDNRVGRRAERELEVRKFRGSSYLRGGHAFEITQSGLVVYPRIEALLQNPGQDDDCTTAMVSTGLPALDEALHGGLRCASSTVLFGPTGAGKTTVALHFLNEASAEEPALLFGFYETPPRILLKGTALGLDLESKLRAGVFHTSWQPATERMLDALGHSLLAQVSKHGIKRLVVDGVDGLLKAATHPTRLSQFLSALTNELRIRGVTTLYTIELQELLSPPVELPMQGISSLVENIVLIRFIEQQSRLFRALSIIKTRDRSYDDRVRELLITSRGAMLGDVVDVRLGTMRQPAKPKRKAVASKRTAPKKRGKKP